MCMYRYTYISIFTHPQICRYFSETRFFHACCHTYVYTRTYVHMYIERRVLQKMDHTTIVRNPQSSLGLTFLSSGTHFQIDLGTSILFGGCSPATGTKGECNFSKDRDPAGNHGVTINNNSRVIHELLQCHSPVLVDGYMGLYPESNLFQLLFVGKSSIFTGMLLHNID